MPNVLLTPDVIAQEALMQLENELVFGGLVHRDHTSEFSGSKKGDTVTIRKPATFVADEFDGVAVNVQTATEDGIPLTLEKHFDVTFEVTSKQKTLELQDFSEQLIQPAVIALAQGVDAYCASKVRQFDSVVGAQANAWDAVTDFAAINKHLNDARVPKRPRVGIVGTQTELDFYGVSQFTDAEKRADGGEAMRNANMGFFMGVDWFMDQNAGATHTAGVGGSATIDGAHAAAATSITLTGGDASGTYKEGDVVTFAGIAGSYLVAADVTLSSGAGTIVVSPGLASAASGGESVTQAASHPLDVVMHPNAMSLAVVPLELPFGAGADSAYLNTRGLGIRVVSGYDVGSKKDTISLDLLCGAKVQDPRLGTRVGGAQA